MTMITGTCHFVTREAAIRYYEPYGFDAADVQRKLDDGEIRLGEPPLQPGQKSFLVDDGTRYAIEE